MACGCGANKPKTFSDIVLKDGSSLPYLKYIHCKYQDQFESQFQKIGITANEQNLKMLAYVSDNGLDKNGTLKDSKGNPIYFSVEDILKLIDISKPVNNLCTL